MGDDNLDYSLLLTNLHNGNKVQNITPDTVIFGTHPWLPLKWTYFHGLSSSPPELSLPPKNTFQWPPDHRHEGDCYTPKLLYPQTVRALPMTTSCDDAQVPETVKLPTAMYLDSPLPIRPYLTLT